MVNMAIHVMCHFVWISVEDYQKVKSSKIPNANVTLYFKTNVKIIQSKGGTKNFAILHPPS